MIPIVAPAILRPRSTCEGIENAAKSVRHLARVRAGEGGGLGQAEYCTICGVHWDTTVVLDQGAACRTHRTMNMAAVRLRVAPGRRFHHAFEHGR